jgi:hypothetical protein
MATMPLLSAMLLPRPLNAITESRGLPSGRSVICVYPKRGSVLPLMRGRSLWLTRSTGPDLRFGSLCVCGEARANQQRAVGVHPNFRGSTASQLANGQRENANPFALRSAMKDIER